MSPLNSICQQLKTEGRRVTPQRRAIIKFLLTDGIHPTAEQVFTHVRQTMPGLSPATVYNTLHELVELGVLSELDLGLGERHYDINTEDHAHLVCLECGRVEDVPCDLSAVRLSSEQAQRFRVVDCQVTFRGYCSDCTPPEG
jgi:Fur family peroxide stress response transcriptional regulator